jgi:hypothetical protein
MKPLAVKMDQSKLRLKLVPGEVTANSGGVQEDIRVVGNVPELHELDFLFWCEPRKSGRQGNSKSGRSL